MTKGMKIELKRTDKPMKEPGFMVKNAEAIRIKALDYFFQDLSNDTLQAIHEKAMENLEEGRKWPHSIQGDAISENVRIVVHRKREDEITGMLEYFSPHAAVVELGSYQTVAVAKEGKPSFPIGVQQYGEPLAYSRTIKLQPPKYFLTRAVQEILGSGRIEGRTSIGYKKVMRNYLRNL